MEGQSSVGTEFWFGLGTYVVTVIGWYQAKRSQLKADKRRYRANYLIEVIGAIGAGVSRDLGHPINRNIALGVERALEKIQFLGTKEQVDLTLDLMNHLQDKKFICAEDTMAKLFTSLRDELRGEFRQEALDPIHAKKFPFIRF